MNPGAVIWVANTTDPEHDAAGDGDGAADSVPDVGADVNVPPRVTTNAVPPAIVFAPVREISAFASNDPPVMVIWHTCPVDPVTEPPDVYVPSLTDDANGFQCK